MREFYDIKLALLNKTHIISITLHKTQNSAIEEIKSYKKRIKKHEATSIYIEPMSIIGERYISELKKLAGEDYNG